MEHKTNDWVRSKINFLMGPQEPLATVMERKLVWFGHAMHNDSLSKTFFPDTFESGRRRGRQKKCRMDHVKKWTSLPMLELLIMAPRRSDWKKDLC